MLLAKTSKGTLQIEANLTIVIHASTSVTTTRLAVVKQLHKARLFIPKVKGLIRRPPSALTERK
jgi:hypothetical protein